MVDSAIEDAKMALSKDPSNQELRSALAAKLAEQNQFRLEEYERRVAAAPTDYTLKFKYGNVLFKNKKYDESIGLFQAAAKDPKLATSSNFMIGKSFFIKKLYDLAAKQYNTALGGLPEQDSDLGKEIRYELAVAHKAKGSKDEALELLEGIMAIDIGFKDVSKLVDEIRGLGE